MLAADVREPSSHALRLHAALHTGRHHKREHAYVTQLTVDCSFSRSRQLTASRVASRHALGGQLSVPALLHQGKLAVQCFLNVSNPLQKSVSCARVDQLGLSAVHDF